MADTSTFDGSSGITKNGYGKFPNPFFDIASEYIPTDIYKVFEWCEYLYLTMGTYRSASRKVVRYFMTDVVLEGQTDDEREEVKEFLDDTLHIKTEMSQIGDEFMTYGNAFISLFFPFDRYLICPECHTEYKDDYLPYKFNANDLQFLAKCPKCEYKGEFEHQDRRSMDRDRVKIIRWNPKQIRLRYHPVSGRYTYYWQIPEEFLKKIREGSHFFLRDTPWSMIECLNKKTGQGVLYQFKDGALYHHREGSLAGVRLVGWGIPPILPNFKLAYYIQVLRRYDEAIALDYIIPFRIMYPETPPASQNADPVVHANLGKVRAQLQALAKKRREDPTTIQVAPFRIGYEMLGGEAKGLAPKESIEFALKEMLNALGYPAELYQGTLSIQAAPVALRLFENTWSCMIDGNNDILAFILKKLCRYFQWGEVTGKFTSVTLADDLERKSLALQGAAGGLISHESAFKPFGIDYPEEQKRVLEEQKMVQELQQKMQEEMQAAAGGGDEAAQQGDPMSGPAGSPADLQAQAQQMAQQLLLMPDTPRRSQLVAMKQQNPTLHALVTQALQDQRQQLGTQGQSMMIEQMRAEQGGVVPM